MSKLMRVRGLSVVFCLVMAACTALPGPTVTRPLYDAYALGADANGKQTYKLTCHGVLEGREVCEQQARQTCGNQKVQVVSPTGAAAVDPRVLTFQCGEPPAPIAAAEPIQQTPVPPAPKPVSTTVYFASGASTLTPEAQQRLSALAGQLQGPVSQARIDGYTDATGNGPLNQRLSIARAKAAERYLRAHGVNAQRYDVQGHGADMPMAPNGSAQGRAQNRRADIELLP
ncbi:MAG: OmpA family protein [Burkholderiales bacterium]|nr:OmpA family protein [Burkholderiales bacterium]